MSDFYILSFYSLNLQKNTESDCTFEKKQGQKDNTWSPDCIDVGVTASGRQDGTSVWHVDGSVCAQRSAGNKKQQLEAKSEKTEIVHKLMIQSPLCPSGIK